MINEADRISKGNYMTLDKLKASDFDAVFIPGGISSEDNF